MTEILKLQERLFYRPSHERIYLQVEMSPQSSKSIHCLSTNEWFGLAAQEYYYVGTSTASG